MQIVSSIESINNVYIIQILQNTVASMTYRLEIPSMRERTIRGRLYFINYWPS